MSTRIGRPTVTIVLSDEERETLERWARRPTSAQALALRCRIVLAAAEGTSNRAIARALDCHPVTVGKWRRRFAQWRLDGLQDEPRPGAPRTITDAQVEAVIVKTLEEQPSDATHWSTRSMAAALGMSQSAIVRIWSAFGLKPHLVESFKLSPDPQFIDKVRDVAGLYLNPPDAAVVLCVDEKTQVQALDRTAPMLPMRDIVKSCGSAVGADQAASLPSVTSSLASGLTGRSCNPPSTKTPPARTTATRCGAFTRRQRCCAASSNL